MYEKLLVVLDPAQETQKALGRALHLARIQPSQLTLFVSIYDFAYEMTTMLSGEEREQMRQSLIADQEAWIRDQIRNYDSKDLVIDIVVVWHHRPFEAIIKQAIEGNYDLIVKGTQKHDTLQSVIFTPTDWHLLRKAPSPVLLVKDHDWPQHGSVLAAVNAASDSDIHQGLNRKILKAAGYISKKLNSYLHIVNCFPGAPASIAVEIPEFDTHQYQASVREHHETSLLNIAQEVDVDFAGLHLREGLPDDEVPRVANELDAELVVLGTIGRTGITAALLGNTAEHVIEQLNCDLLAIKPEGFKSPMAKN
ncbi:universal stress protein UspE [Aliidiomarina halalkaliphila]|uniref:Universal stress protein UspE n=1 Tax=Aliidiomarina halalkaliphila TaxID=2593535 RepID=A0A552X405_9GAMM|nr:universal stress protein UspE [Aliidiomarina halalkaliphila]TRW49762.1 universal stress protein UspE [Aliidiomarina halalkaliphila]